MSQDRHHHGAATSAEENAMFLDTLEEAPPRHRQSRSVVASVIYCLLLTGYAVVAVIAPWIFNSSMKLLLPFLCSCNVFLLILTGIFQQYWAHQVMKVRLQGYYIFSQKLKHIVRIPFLTISYGTALMLLAMVWQPHIGILSIATMLRIIIFIEIVCAGCFKSIYIGCVHQYNKLDEQPDILKPLFSALQPSSSLEDLRYHDGGRLSDQQMALLQYQRETIHFLNEEILHLQECLSKYKQTDDGGTPQVDLAHLLAARDQELRALFTEMNQVHSEVHLARNLIAERDSENQRIRLANSQYVEENQRLRGILAEWSARAAKYKVFFLMFKSLNEHWKQKNKLIST